MSTDDDNPKLPLIDRRTTWAWLSGFAYGLLAGGLCGWLLL
jgi:hypothetical protein